MEQRKSTSQIIDDIKKIIDEPVHGKQFYQEGQFNELIQKLVEISGELEIDNNTSQKNIVSILNNYVKQNVNIRRKYFDAFTEHTIKFDDNELIYRTAYGGLVKGEAMCAGYAESLRVLLAVYGIKSKTMVTRLPGKDKHLLHYVVVAEVKEAGKTNYVVLDPERQFNCETKGYDFDRYQNGMTYMIPREGFSKDVVGTNGVGMSVEEYVPYLENYDKQHGTNSFSVGLSGIEALYHETERSENLNQNEDKECGK